MSHRKLTPFLILAALIGTAAAPGQCGSLSTSFGGGTYCTNGGGPMFDVVALNLSGVHINAVDANLNAGTHTISVYAITGGGSFVGSELNAGAWTLLGTTTVVSTANGVPTFVPMVFDVFIPSGATQGFHVRAAAGGLRYNSSGGQPLGSVLAADGNIQILLGKSQCDLGSGPFSGSVPSPRAFDGSLYYDREFQINSPAASLDFDGVQGTFCTPALVSKSPGATTVLNLATANVGASFEALVALAPIIPRSGGAAMTLGGQIIGVSLSQPFFLNGGFFPAFVPLPGSLSLSFVTSLSGVTVSIQMAVADPTHPEGLVFSQPAQISFL